MTYWGLVPEAPPVLPGVVLLPAPEPVLLGVLGGLPGVALPGVALPGVALPGVVAVPPVLAPLVMPSFFRHSSRSVPIGLLRHLLLLVLPVALGVLPVALGVLPDALGVLPDAPVLELPEAPLALLPVAPPEALLSEGLLVDPGVCAIETLAIAKSAAAVAVPTSLNILFFLLRKWDGTAGRKDAINMPVINIYGWHGISLCIVPMHTRTQLQIGAAATLAAAAFVHQRAWKAERANPPIGRFIEVDGVRLHYLERGEGPPLLMLHGNGSMIEELKLSGLFDLAAARYRLIVPDRPGYGHSSRPRRKWWGPHAQAALLRSMLAQLGIERPIVFGHSFGAMVAMAFALDYPAATRGVVLASGYYFPTARLDVPLMAPPAIPIIGDALRHTISPLIGRLLWPSMLKLVFSPAPVPKYFERFPTWMALRPSQLRASAEEAAALIPSALQMQRLYGALEVPAVIVGGAQDRYVDNARHSVELAKRIPGAELLVSPRAGHMVHHVDPRRVLQAIEAAARKAA